MKVIDADAHMVEPPDLWVERVDRRYRDRAPRVVKDPDGKKGAFYVGESGMQISVAQVVGAGVVLDAEQQQRASVGTAPRGGADPARRLEDMDVDGIEAAVLYTSFGMGIFQFEDGELQRECFRVYNNWLAEFCNHAPDRLLGLAMISMYDVPQACRELERCRDLGLRGAMVWAAPPGEESFAVPEYQSFWAAAQALDMPISLHQGTGRRAGKAGGSAKAGSSPATPIVNAVVLPQEIQHSLVTLVFSGVLERFPGLRFVAAEADISWVAPLWARADKYYRRWSRMWDTGLTMAPSDYHRRQLYYTFIDDPIGVQMYQLQDAGDNFMWSTDYPHEASTWPNSRQAIAGSMGSLDEADRTKMLRDNVARLYGITVDA